ncbi:polyprenyl diphosphate synthase [Gracilinema caldarium]|uniref:Isoprenyl transferase n=1 Tax=Gracilinema caldarium (strain ATCC 51460 / DSM 7334 / H1) TaxID=744872 RepID=F8F3I7_GRAC1|nr:polyprenyl diphosphate synthase [Gracilinema caldarium]AEJ19563.1 Undecaprenyl pyrophosphate synthase [Gracilinema caldarium DSM 7334]
MTNLTIPAHVGIIMDGNGRWAQSRNMARTQGHLEGLKAAKRIVKAASDMGISYLTLYTFSTENWKRTQDEVGFIMGLVKKYLMAEFDFYQENKIRIRFTGNLEGLPQDIAQEVIQVCEKTAHFPGLSVILALNYGGRDEIVRAVKKIIQQGLTPATITEATIYQYLDNPDVPDPDLIIRTASELRSSNFLLWESAYSEFYFSDKLWPDWDMADLENAVQSYQNRKRRFGGITA